MRRAVAGPALPVGPFVMGALLVVLYVFLYAPILYVIYTSFAEDIVWPFPPRFSLQSYADLFHIAAP